MRILPTKETLTIEFKSDIKKYPDNEIFEVVVAFANTEGGDLYLGIEDSGEITGANKAHQNPITLSAYIANNTVPPISVRADIIDEEKPILKISVPKSYSGIIATSSGKVLRRRIKADGTPENVVMYPAEFATRLSDLRLLDYSAMPVMKSSMNDFDPLEVERLRNYILAYNGDKSLLDLTDEELYKALGLVREQNNMLIPTITGLLLIGKTQALEQFIPTASAVFQVLEGTKVRMNENLNLPVVATVEKITTYMSAWNPEQEIEMGLFRVPIPSFDKRAVREAIINAFSHRDYTKMGRIRIAVSDEGLTIASPGGFIEGISITNLLTAEPHGRNPQLADALKRIGLAERTGRGIDRIYEGSLLYGKLLPDYTASTSVTVSLFLVRSNPDPQIARLVSDEQNRLGRPLSVNTLLVLNTLKDLPRSTTVQLSEAIHLSEILVRSILNKMIESGLVDKYGTGRGQTYILSPNVYKTKEKRIGYVHQVDIDESRYRELILSLAKRNSVISRADVVKLLHVQGEKAYKLLRKLVDDGKLDLVTKGKYAKYQWHKE